MVTSLTNTKRIVRAEKISADVIQVLPYAGPIEDSGVVK